MWDVLATGNNFAYVIVFFSSTIRISVFERSLVAHDLILPSVCARRAYPQRFLGRVGRTPYRRDSPGDGSKCRRGKGLKTVCLGARCTSGTRPIVYLAMSLARGYNSDPGVDHWTTVKIILRHLKRTKEMFLGYGGHKEFVLKGYIDASFATDPDDSESQSRYILKVGAIS